MWGWRGGGRCKGGIFEGFAGSTDVNTVVKHHPEATVSFTPWSCAKSQTFICRGEEQGGGSGRRRRKAGGADDEAAWSRWDALKKEAPKGFGKAMSKSRSVSCWQS